MIFEKLFGGDKHKRSLKYFHLLAKTVDGIYTTRRQRIVGLFTVLNRVKINKICKIKIEKNGSPSHIIPK